ncbi:hypothetical protein L596_020686 [Steinernema carpocapsae]|uniref:Poly(A) RNA polymerase mitochondrial-like central palm domain-containing protein n=1 Tax=Steinernema carpocapsae TaxID=34508 RepID=A0A4U5MUC5_STECR|nr:hypothetical protein L596_020686 [Steinernema carpocapsae]
MDTKHPENLWVTSVPEEESSSVFEKMKNFKAEYPEKLATFNREIEAYFEKRSAKSQDLAVKERVRDELQKVANEIFPRCEVVIGGSTASHLATAKSDLDLCLFVAEVDGSYAQNRDSTLRILRRFYDSLRINLPSSMADIEFIHWARVPIVILKCTREYDNLQVDIPCNKVNSMKTTHLIYHYVRFDDRVAKLKLAVKCWATNIGILNSMQGRLSSFHLTLMVIHFLQSVCTPSILPNLDKLFPGAFEKATFGTSTVTSARAWICLSKIKCSKTTSPSGSCSWDSSLTMTSTHGRIGPLMCGPQSVSSEPVREVWTWTFKSHTKD